MEGVRARWCWWMLYSRLIQRDSPRDASRSSNKALLFFLFFFLEYCWVCSSRILWAPSLPPQPFEDASESFSRRYRACFSADVSNEYCNAAAAMQRGYLGSKDRCRFNVKLAAEGLSLYSCCAAQRWQPASAALKSFHKIVLILDEFFLWLKLS